MLVLTVGSEFEVQKVVGRRLGTRSRRPNAECFAGSAGPSRETCRLDASLLSGNATLSAQRF